MTLWREELSVVEAAWADAQERHRRRVDAEVTVWGDAIADLAAAEARIRSEGRWTSGPSELMAVLGVHHDEVRNCRVLRWLLDSEGAHGLGDRMLRSLLARLAIEPPSDRGLALSTVAVEEGRSFERPGTHRPTVVGTRADLVIRVGDTTVVIEAKTFAPEGRGQCSNLEVAWGPDAHLVFLTRHGASPSTAAQIERWSTLRWQDVADDLDEALTATAATSPASGRPAALEFLTSVRRYLT